MDEHQDPVMHIDIDTTALMDAFYKLGLSINKFRSGQVCRSGLAVKQRSARGYPIADDAAFQYIVNTAERALFVVNMQYVSGS